MRLERTLARATASAGHGALATWAGVLVLCWTAPLAAQGGATGAAAVDTVAAQAPDPELRQLVGWYGTRSLPVEIGVELVSGALQATVTGQPPRKLVPDSPMRFRVDGLPDVFLTFELDGERATMLRFEQPTNTIELYRVP